MLSGPECFKIINSTQVKAASKLVIVCICPFIVKLGVNAGANIQTCLLYTSFPKKFMFLKSFSHTLKIYIESSSSSSILFILFTREGNIWTGLGT